MKFSLINNGADSLKNAYINIGKVKELEEGKDYTLKDAVIFLNHGIEILLKVILSNRSFALIFDNIKEYQKAKIELSKSDKKDVFEVNPNLKTVSLIEALIRVQYLCDIEINDEMKDAVLALNSVRNKIMHFSVEIDDDEVIELTKRLEFCYNAVNDFFEEHIESFEDFIDKARFEYTVEDHYQDEAEWQAEIMMEEHKLGYLD